MQKHYMSLVKGNSSPYLLIHIENACKITFLHKGKEK